MFRDSLGQFAPQSADILHKMGRGGVDLDAHGVDRRDDHVVQTAPQKLLIHIVLILPDADSLGIDLDQFGKRIHKTPADGD